MKKAKHCLLVVDDEPDLVHSVHDLLRFEYRVLGATRAAEALKKGSTRAPSHERGPRLTMVRGLPALARRTPGVQEPLAHWLERIYAGSVRLNERIDLMIKLLLADRFERPLARKPVDLGE